MAGRIFIATAGWSIPRLWFANIPTVLEFPHGRADGRTNENVPPYDDGRAVRESATRNRLTRSMVAVDPVREVRIATRRIDAWSSRTSGTAPPALIEAIAMPPVDGRRLNQHQRSSPRRPHPSQDQPRQTVRCAKSPVRTRQDGQLLVQGKHLE
jgi:hypothetical protein